MTTRKEHTAWHFGLRTVKEGALQRQDDNEVIGMEPPGNGDNDNQRMQKTTSQPVVVVALGELLLLLPYLQQDKPTSCDCRSTARKPEAASAEHHFGHQQKPCRITDQAKPSWAKVGIIHIIIKID